jgi:hypothetical protein
LRRSRPAAIIDLVAAKEPAAGGLLAKGWAEAERVVARAEAARLNAMSPSDGIREFLALAGLAARLAPPPADGEHLASLVAVAAAFRGGWSD